MKLEPNRSVGLMLVSLFFIFFTLKIVFAQIVRLPGEWERLFTAFSGSEGLLRSRFFLLGCFKRDPISLLFFPFSLDSKSEQKI
jgi:hypothetical protein